MSLPASYYQADNERMESELQRLREENRGLKETVKVQRRSIERYKSDLRESEDHYGSTLRQIVQLTLEIKKLRGEQ